MKKTEKISIRFDEILFLRGIKTTYNKMLYVKNNKFVKMLKISNNIYISIK